MTLQERLVRHKAVLAALKADTKAELTIEVGELELRPCHLSKVRQGVISGIEANIAEIIKELRLDDKHYCSEGC